MNDGRDDADQSAGRATAMRSTGRVGALLSLAGALLLLLAFGLLLDQSGSGFLLAYVGMNYPNVTELVFGYYYLLTATPALLLLAFSAWKSGAGARLEDGWERFVSWRFSLHTVALAALILILALRVSVLRGVATTQDEYVYDFIADTLAEGRVTNPLPAEPGYFANEFMILGERGWYGKYPIGHPLLLAAAGLLGARPLAVPLVSVALLLVTFALGARIFDRRTALLGTALLSISPQLLLTGATLLSQPASALAATLGLLGLVALEERPRAATALCSGLAFGFGVLIRPLPGLLFLPVALVYVLARVRGRSKGRTLALWSFLGLGVLAGLAAFAAVNLAQTGELLRTGYHVDSRSADPLDVLDIGHSGARIASSLFNGLARLHLWQAGFPLLVLAAFLARRTARSGLLWGMLAALVSYRVLAPKAGVVSTGPVYLYEALPWLALLCADGLRRASEVPSWRWLAERGRRAALVASGVAVAGMFFWPVNLESLAIAVRDHQHVYDVVEKARSGGAAVVFYEARIQGTWARRLRNPRPDLTDEVLYLRRQSFSYAELEAFAVRRFPQRSRWALLFQDGGNPRVVPLSELVEQERQNPRPARPPWMETERK